MKYVKISLTGFVLFISLCALYLFLGYLNINLSPLPTIKSYIVLSGSMEPEIPTGSVVFVKKENYYITGDIVTFSPKGNKTEVVTHRIVNVERDSVYNGNTKFQTKGDANKTPDNWEINEKNVSGRVIFSLPYLGYIASVAKDPKGFIALVIIPATIIVYEELKTTKREILKLFKKKRIENPDYVIEEDKGIPKSSAIIPIIGAFFVIAAASGAYFSDSEISIENIFAAAESYDETPPPIQGSVVINEINWGGSNGDGNDEWIELKNMTNSAIDISNWVVENLGLGGPNANLTIPSGSTIPANGFFLISNDNKDNSKINVDSDFVTSSVSLNNDGENLILKDNLNNVIDDANGTGSWYKGSNSTPKKSMERKNPPGDGTISGNWQTATTHTNMDASGTTDEFATPKAENGI